LDGDSRIVVVLLVGQVHFGQFHVTPGAAQVAADGVVLDRQPVGRVRVVFLANRTLRAAKQALNALPKWILEESGMLSKKRRENA